MSHPATRKRLPPFGREFLRAQAEGRPVNPFVHHGSHPRAWELARARTGGLVCPADESPSAFDWSCLRGLDVVVAWPGGSIPEVDELAAAIMADGASTVHVLADVRGPDGAPWTGDGPATVVRGHRRHAREVNL